MRARRAMSRRGACRSRSSRSCAATAAATAATSCTSGIAVLFVGVAASSSFQDERDVRLVPGQTASVGGYDVTLRQADRDAAAPTASWRRSTSARGCACAATASTSATLRTETRLLPVAGSDRGPVSRFFEGEATSEVGLRAGWRRDIWTAIAPDIGALRAADRGGRQALPRDADARAAQARSSPQALGPRALLRADPPPATFRLIVSPLVTWIWIGALIVLLGGLIALWPAAAPARRGPPSARAFGRGRGRRDPTAAGTVPSA